MACKRRVCQFPPRAETKLRTAYLLLQPNCQKNNNPDDRRTKDVRNGHVLHYSDLVGPDCGRRYGPIDTQQGTDKKHDLGTVTVELL